MSTAKKIETRRQRVVHMDGLIELSGNSRRCRICDKGVE